MEPEVTEVALPDETTASTSSVVTGSEAASMTTLDTAPLAFETLPDKAGVSQQSEQQTRTADELNLADTP